MLFHLGFILVQLFDDKVNSVWFLTHDNQSKISNTTKDIMKINITINKKASQHDCEIMQKHQVFWNSRLSLVQMKVMWCINKIRSKYLFRCCCRINTSKTSIFTSNASPLISRFSEQWSNSFNICCFILDFFGRKPYGLHLKKN